MVVTICRELLDSFDIEDRLVHYKELQSEPLVYNSSPIVTGKNPSSVQAVVQDLGASGNYHLTLTGRDDELYVSCSCRRNQACSHGVRLALDIACSPTLRKSLTQPTDPQVLILALRDDRKRFIHGNDNIEPVVDAWLPVRKEVRSGPFDLSIESSEDFSGGWSLTLFIREVGARARIDPRDAFMTRFPEPLQGILELASDGGAKRKGWQFDGATAAIVLDELANFTLRFEKGLVLARSPLVVRPEVVFSEVEVYAPIELSAHQWRDSRYPSPRAAPAKIKKKALLRRWCREDGTALADGSISVFLGPRSWLLDSAGRTLYRIARDVDLDSVRAMRFNRPAVLPDEYNASQLFSLLRDRVSRTGVALPPPEEFGLAPLEKPSLVLRIEGSPLDVKAQLFAQYAAATHLVSIDQPTDVASYRDLPTEREAFDYLHDHGWQYHDTLKCFEAEGDSAARWWFERVPALRAESKPSIALEIAAALASATVRRKIKSRTKVSFAQNWFELDARFTADDLAVDLASLRAALEGKRSFVALADGTLAELTESLRESATEVLDLLGGKAKGKVSRFALGRIDRFAERENVVLDERALAVRQKLKATSVAPQPSLPVDLRAELRGYQKSGLAWMQFLDELGVGGILADDMGLGKTVVTIAYLLDRKARDGTAPSLVVAPASVVGNWKRECEKFAPGLVVEVLHGSGREARLARWKTTDVFVTTYGVVRQDQAELAKLSFRAVIFDEAQFVKNNTSVTADAARTIVATTRIALTGTPVENHLGELWAILDLINPGMLGTARDFDARYGRPIAAGDTHALARLQTLTRPFVLRRTKREVLSELPPKVEIDQVVRLTRAQRTMYDGLALILRNEVDAEVSKKGLAKSTFNVLTALLRLRQVACDPRLVDETRHGDESGKKAAFFELVRALIAEGRRVLVFSQFVSLFTLWRVDLEREEIEYVYLDGSTVNREDKVRAFQEGTAPLFLISLKAGGTGLNLTAADTVIHLDPWWNPAVEDQATDRAHRIGQTRSVTVYRLIAEGTVEEKIAVLKGHKRALAEAVIRADNGALAGLTPEDVQLLLSEATGGESDDLDESELADTSATPRSAAPELKPKVARLPQRRAVGKKRKAE